MFEPDFGEALTGMASDYTAPPGYFDDDVLHLFCSINLEAGPGGEGLR